MPTAHDHPGCPNDVLVNVSNDVMSRQNVSLQCFGAPVAVAIPMVTMRIPRILTSKRETSTGTVDANQVGEDAGMWSC